MNRCGVALGQYMYALKRNQTHRGFIPVNEHLLEAHGRDVSDLIEEYRSKTASSSRDMTGALNDMAGEGCLSRPCGSGLYDLLGMIETLQHRTNNYEIPVHRQYSHDEDGVQRDYTVQDVLDLRNRATEKLQGMSDWGCFDGECSSLLGKWLEASIEAPLSLGSYITDWHLHSFHAKPFDDSNERDWNKYADEQDTLWATMVARRCFD